VNYETYKAAEAAARELLREWRREIFDAIVDCEGPDTVREWLDELNEKEDEKC